MALKTTSVTVGIPVRDLTRAREWYERVFELSGPDLESVEGVVEYELGGCWLQLGEENGGRASRSEKYLAGKGLRRGEAREGSGQPRVVGERRRTRLAFPVDGLGELHPDPAPRVIPVCPVADELLS